MTFPQLSTGALSQFPIAKQMRMRTVVNAASDGSSIKIADPAGETVGWQLQYAGLSDSELSTLEQFFASAEGSLNAFTFVDPTANLFAQSDNLGDEAWIKDPALALLNEVSDPEGGTQAWRLTNSGLAVQQISQTLQAPGVYLYCLSAYVRSNSAGTVGMIIGDSQAARVVQQSWSRIVFASDGDPTAASTSFGMSVPPGASVDLYGVQCEAQASASAYKSSLASGVYENARLGNDQLEVVSSGLNNHACTLNIVYVNHL